MFPRRNKNGNHPKAEVNKIFFKRLKVKSSNIRVANDGNLLRDVMPLACGGE